MEQFTSYISELLANNQFLQGGAILGLVTWIGYQLKTIPKLVWEKLKYYITYKVYFDESTEIYDRFTEWLQENYPEKFRNVEVKFAYNDQVASRHLNEPVELSTSKSKKSNWALLKFQYTDSNLMFYNNRWLWVRKERQKLEHAESFRQLFFNTYEISGFFAKKAIDRLCDDLLEKQKLKNNEESLRVYFNAHGYFEKINFECVKTFEHIFFKDKDLYLNDLNKFLVKRDFYKEKGINYKRSYLFYGRGGTGKTSLGLATAQHLGYDLFLINLAAVPSDNELTQLSSRIHNKSIVLLEDIDCVLNQREVKKDRLNFSTVLNFLDGIYAPSDVIFIMTTNKPELLDEALTRKGRVDLALHIDYPGRVEIEQFVRDFYDTDYAVPVFENKKPMSEIQDICLKSETAEMAVAEILKASAPVNGNKVVV